jgi:2-polyprenyl-6-methoxyphenol hydroxylase-like FAD-dependent oxidoreductase
MAEQRTAMIAGGGIAGLATAVALAQAGWQATVLERAPDFGEVGAGLAVTGNGMVALDALGVGQAVRAAGYQTSTAGMQDPSGRWLLRVPDTGARLRAVTTFWGLHRRRLHAALLAAARAADGVELVTGAEVTAVQPGQAGAEPATLTWRTSAGPGDTPSRKHSFRKQCFEREAGLVVAADGVRSTVRTQLYPAARPRYSGSTCWRAVIPDSGSEGRLIETWGPGTEFGALRVSEGEIYWFGYFRYPEGAHFDDELAAARDRFSGWSPRIRDLVAATTADRLVRHDVYHLPGGLHTYVRGRVVMIGDAAHAALPTVGGGASTALEDAVCLGRLVASPVAAGADLGTALAGFDQVRRARCRKITRMATLVARFGADLGGGWRQPVRNAALRLTPPRLMATAAAPIVNWSAPGQ